MGRGLPYVDEADVIVAVRRGKAPGPATGLNREEDAYAVLLLSIAEAAQDLGSDVFGDHGFLGQISYV